MTRKTKIIFGSVFGLLLLCSLLTGGLYVDDRYGFEGSFPHDLAPHSTPHVWLEPRYSDSGVPLLAVYHLASGPYSLNLTDWDGAGTYRTLNVTKVSVRYADGTTDEPTIDWSKQKYHNRYRSSQDLSSWTDVPDIVTKRQDNTTIVTGYLEKENGEKTPFEAKIPFKLRHERLLTSYWLALALSD